MTSDTNKALAVSGGGGLTASPSAGFDLPELCKMLTSLEWNVTDYNAGIESVPVSFLSQPGEDKAMFSALMGETGNLDEAMDRFHQVVDRMVQLLEGASITHAITTEGSTIKFHLDRKAIEALQSRHLPVPPVVNTMGPEIDVADLGKVNDIFKAIRETVQAGQGKWSVQKRSPGGIGEQGGYIGRLQKNVVDSVTIQLDDLKKIDPSLPNSTSGDWEQKTRTALGDIVETFKRLGVQISSSFGDDGIKFHFDANAALELFSHPSIQLPSPLMNLVRDWVKAARHGQREQGGARSNA